MSDRQSSTMVATCEFTLTDRDYQRISQLVYDHCGINLHEGKRELVRARIAKRLRAKGLTSVSEYMDHVMADSSGSEFAVLIDAMSTNLTSFFREAGHFTHLNTRFLPRLIERKRAAGSNRIRVWSAGCSTGEEPYSLAITLLEALEGTGSWDVKILASDISTHVLKVGGAGAYARSRTENLPVQYRSKYFRCETVGGEQVFTALPVLKQMIHFRHLNLMAPWPFSGPFDFIFCRNVMIYFDKPTQQRLVGRYWDCLAPGGLLFTGHT
jgi:chemotaxis protein methyltransferase CheR